MDSHKEDILFDSSDKKYWLAKISELYDHYDAFSSPHNISLSFKSNIRKEDIEPVHLVTLACLIQYLFDKGHRVFMSSSNRELYDYIYNDLDFSAYWKGGKNHVDANTSHNIFNLWRIMDSEKDLYAKNVERYFNDKFFYKKDLSAINVCLVEAFYNVFDHAEANKNAFSLLRYDEVNNKLLVAIADFGIGIVNSVRNFNNISDDIEAMKWALRDHSTVKSTTHNMGLGMGNILAIASCARIFSGDALYVVSPPDNEKWFNINFRFPGTLIYLDIDLDSFEDAEILESFNW